MKRKVELDDFEIVQIKRGELTLDDFESILKNEGVRCRMCVESPKLVRDIEHYPHGAGWKVKGFDRKQWLYVVCPDCGYEWALHKLGFPR